MPKLSVSLGIGLIILGLISYFGTGGVSITALIPAFFGIIFVVLGVIANISDKALKHTMHVAALLAVIGLIGSIGGIIDLFQALGGASLESPAASWSQAIMALGLVVFLIFVIKSFRDARRAKEAQS